MFTVRMKDFSPNLVATSIALVVLTCGVAPVSAAKLFKIPQAEFTDVVDGDTTAAHFDDGGWLVHTIPLMGDLLYGCPSINSADPGCTLVTLPIRTPGTIIEKLYVSPENGAAWMKVTAPPLGDFIFACYEPTGANPRCEHVRLKDRPLGKLERFDSAATTASGGALALIPMPGLAKAEEPTPVEDDSGAVATDHPDHFWLKSSILIPGPVNLYACRGLSSKAECSLGINALDFLQGEFLGISKLSGEDLEDSNNPLAPKGILVGKVDDDSAAASAGITVDTVIVKAAGFPLYSVPHFKGLLAQIAAGKTIELTLKSGKSVKVKRKRKQKKSKK